MTNENLFEIVERLRNSVPLVHNITNYVVMNNTANALLSLGASPIMAHAIEEVKDLTAICGSLVINIGTLSNHWVQGMIMAVESAVTNNKPWVLDPVGAGASAYRNETIAALLETANPTVIRGNASEIIAVHNANSQTKGVDSTHSSDAALEAAKALALRYKCCVCISGATDYIVAEDRLARLSNGSKLMTKVTGMGCTATAIIGAFLAIEVDGFNATTAAMAYLGVAGEIAEKKASGPGSFQMQLLDALYEMPKAEFIHRTVLEASDRIPNQAT